MASPVRAAAIYARISSDQDGTTLGVQRQLQDCRKLAADMGCSRGRVRPQRPVGLQRPAPPEYERMLTDLADGSRDAVLIYHVDRLTRRPIELEQFLDVRTAAKVRHVRFVAGGR